MYDHPSTRRPTALTTRHVGFAACAVQLNAASAEVQLFPAGPFRARDGRPHDVDNWHIDADIARRLIAAAALRKTPYVIDYEHQTLLAELNGQPAPRAAKFSQLEWREGDGLYAVDVVWTTRAKNYIESDEYEFISPVFSYDESTGAVLEFYHAALTNDPALDGMNGVAERVAARFNIDQHIQEDDQMNKALLKLLGLKDDASDDDVQQAVAALKAQSEVQTAVIAALDIDADADPVAAIAALKSSPGAKPDPAKFVPVDVVNDLQTRVAALTTQINTAAVDDLVAVALSKGKLLPKQEDWARELGESNIASLKSYLDKTTPIAALTGGQTGGHEPSDGGDGTLTAAELAVCTQMGIDPEEFKKQKEA